MRPPRFARPVLALIAAVGAAWPPAPAPADEARRPATEAELRYWLAVMAVDHRYTPEEIRDATGLSLPEVADALRRFDLVGKAPAPRKPGDPLRIRPYPGGRHPRIGFLDGAIDPQRETKVSVFAPWDDASYVVVDVPEAVMCNRTMIYLAHTHVPTVWEQKGVKLPRLEWTRRADGSLTGERTLPDGVAFGATVTPTPTEVRMELWVRNGSDAPLADVWAQNCVMLARAAGFAAQTDANKVLRPPYAAARSDDGRRWIITAWTPTRRCWANPPCPCLHADPRLPDCPPGATVRAHGRLSFYEGDDLDAELDRIEKTGWRD